MHGVALSGHNRVRLATSICSFGVRRLQLSQVLVEELGDERSERTHDDGKIKELATLGPGEIFGEMALVIDHVRAASVEALENTNLIVITREVLQRKLARSDSTVQAIFKMLVRRMAVANETVVGKKTNPSDLIKSSQDAYDNILAALPASQQTTFEDGVKPHLDALVNAIEAFNERYSK